MAGKRKGKSRAVDTDGCGKRQKIAHTTDAPTNVVRSALLSQLYPQVVSLREYLLLKLPKNSKIRRRKIQGVTTSHDQRDTDFARFLDETLVGVTRDKSSSVITDRWKQWTTFSQRVDVSTSTIQNSTGIGKFSQSEVSLQVPRY
jgi:hypothetical protein